MSGFLYLALALGVVGFAFNLTNRRKYSFDKEYSKCESPIEQKMMKILKEAGYRPYTQVKSGFYRIDIALYKGKRKFAIECDGKAYHTSKEQRAHDRKKNVFLKKKKWHVIRLEGTHIHSSPEYSLEVIRNRVK